MNILVVGAHPDDCEIAAGGMAALWRRRGDRVRFVSLTDGGAGHQSMAPAELVRRRREEARRAAAVVGAESEVWDLPDGRLEPAVEHRLRLIRLVRSFRADLVLTHRPSDYHPDHRAASVLVQDSAYLVTVPLICPEVPHLERNPAIACFFDTFRRPVPFQVDAAVPVDEVMDLKWEMLHAHASQFYEWLPYNQGCAGEVPPEGRDEERRAWLRKHWGPYLERVKEPAKDRVESWFGLERALRARYVEAFELSELGRQPDRDELWHLFAVAR